MNFDVGDSKLLNLWQTLHFGAESSDSTPSKQADSLRGILTQINSVYSRDSYLRLFRQYTDKYCKIIDNQDTDKGLNNFAEPVLSLVTGHRNDSANWKSSLSLEAIKKSAVWDNVIKHHEASRSGIPNTPSHVATQKPTTEQHPECTTSEVPKPDSREWKEKQPDKPVSMTTSNSESSNKRKFHTFYSDARTKPTSAQAIDKTSTWTGNTVDQNMPTNRQKNWDINPGPYSTAKPRYNATRQSTENAVDQNNQATRQKNWDIDPGTHNNVPSFGNPSRQGVGGSKEQHSANQQKRINPGSHNNFSSLQTNREQNHNNFPSDETSSEFQEQPKPSRFITAKQQYVVDCKTKNQRGAGAQASKGSGAQASRGPDRQASSSGYGAFARRTLGSRRGPGSKFVPPIPRSSSDEDMEEGCRNRKRSKGRTNGDMESENGMELEQDERLKGIESKMVELIMNEIMDHGPPITWDDIAGLEFAKNVIKEIVIWPMLRPDIFKGLRGPPKGLLLFGPPGTGKTLIGKCIASQSKATFFSISASSLTSKWVGEGEKMVRALFAVARCHLPAVIFIDEIDSLLTQRTDGEHEASRRIKTEFLVQLDGATTNTDERLLVVGATNRPQEIDEAARRRLVKRLYIPLPDEKARQQIIHNLLDQQSFSLTEQEITKIVTCSQGYSGSDMSNLCREAAIGPIRCIATADIENISADQVRPIEYRDFDAALSQVRASVSQKDLELYTEWNTLYGSGSK